VTAVGNSWASSTASPRPSLTGYLISARRPNTPFAPHRGLPPSTIRQTFHIDANKPIEIKIVFKVSSLSDWKGWTSKSKEFMKASGTYFELKPLVADYQNLVVSFYRWFDSELNNTHKVELDELENLKRKIVEFEQG